MKALYVLITLSLVMLTVGSCERTSQQVPGVGDLRHVDLSDVKYIPENYGELVGVTTQAAFKGWAQLWFEDEGETIRMVRIQFLDGRVQEAVLVIPRN